MIDWQRTFNEAHAYEAFLSKYGSEDHVRKWAETYERVSLDASQSNLLRFSIRELNVLCMAGAWCGDCAMQCPIFRRFSESGAPIRLRFVDRDENAEVATALRICGGARVPVVVFLSEDFQECGRYGDRTLARYRQLAASQIANGCSGAPKSHQALLAEITSDWLAEFERIQLMLRISPRLRKLHGD